MRRCVPILAAIALCGPGFAAQQGSEIKWSLQAERGVAQAQQAKRPLMFWVLGGSDSRDDRLERDQRHRRTHHQAKCPPV